MFDLELANSGLNSRYGKSDDAVSERELLPRSCSLADRRIAWAAARIFTGGMCSGSLFGGSEVLLLGASVTSLLRALAVSLLGAVILLLQ